MSDNTTPDAPAHTDQPTAVQAVDARTGESGLAPAPADADTQELIEAGGDGEAVTAEAHEVSPGYAAPPEPEAGSVADAVNEEPAARPKKAKAKRLDADADPTAVEAAIGDATAAASGAVSLEQVEEAAGGAEAPAAPAEPAPPENKKKWYAIKVQSGREDTIKAAILRKVAIEGLEDVFGQVMIPVDKVIEKRAVKVKDKKTGEYTTQEKKVERKVKKFQGYIFAEMEFTDRLLYLIRETSGVGDFLKLRPRPNDTPLPEPMSDAEVKQMLGEKVGPDASGKQKVKVEFEKGDRVRIREGSFKDSEGEVKEVILPKDPTDPPKVIVVVTFWGRPLDVELEYWQVVKA